MHFKIISVLLLLITILSVSQASSASEFGDFVIGTIEGLEFTVSSKAKDCIRNTKHTISEFDSAFDELDSAISHKSISDTKSGLKKLGSALVEVPILYEECGVSKFVSEIKSISSKLESGDTGIIEVIIKEIINIFHNSHDLTSDFKAAIADKKKSDYTDCGVNVGKIVGILLKD